MKNTKEMTTEELENYIKNLKKEVKQKKKIQEKQFIKNRNIILCTIGALILKENPALFNKDDIVKKLNKAEVEKRLSCYELKLKEKEQPLRENEIRTSYFS